MLACLALASCVGSVGLAGDAESNCRDYQALLDASAVRCGGYYKSDGLDCSDVLVFSVDWGECKAYLESATCAELAQAKLPACQYKKIGAP